MTAAQRTWAVRLTAAAEVDFQGIVEWTSERFGEAQALVYAETLAMALEALNAGPSVLGVKPRDDIRKGLFSLHVALQGRKGRHFVMFRIASRGAEQVVEVLRLLHDSMDLSRHLFSVHEDV